MTLERRQNATDRIISGAVGIGAGRTLGLTDDETIATKKATLRREQRERRAQRGAREGNRAAAEEFLAQEDARFQQKAQADLRELGLGDRAREIDDVAFAFGEDPEYDMYAKDGIDLVEQGSKKRKKKEQRYRMKGQDERMRPQDDGQSYDIMERAYMGLEADPDDINDPDVVRQVGRYQRGMTPEAKGLNAQLELLRKAAAYGAVEPDAVEPVAREMGKRIMEANEGQKLRYVEGGRSYASPADVEGRIDNANPRQREPGGKEQGYRAMRDAAGRLQMGDANLGFANFGAEGESMARIASEVGKRADEGQAVRADREQAQRAVIEDARIRRGDLSQSEINNAVAQAVRAGRPSSTDEQGAKILLGKDEYNPGVPVNNRGMFDRDVEIAARVSAELEARKADGKAGGPERRAVQNKNNAFADAVRIEDGHGQGYVRMRDRNLGRLVEIQPEQFGGLGKASHDPRMSMDFVEVRKDNPSSFGFATPLMRDGKAVGYYGEDMVELGNVNFDNSANGLNAPQLSPAQEWAVKYQPDFGKEGGTTFGYPQVGINEELAVLGDRIRGLKGYGFENVSNPRNIKEVEQALGAVVARAGKLGKNFYRPTPEGKNQKITQPNMNDVLYALGYAQDFDGQPSADKQRLANALIQVQGANQSPVNQTFKDNYSARVARPLPSNVAMDVGEMRPDQGTPIARIPRGAKVGGKQVNAQLRAISEENVLEVLNKNGMLYGPDGKVTPEAAQIIVNARDARRDAQQPFMGALAGEEPERARFIRGKDRGLGEAELVKKYGARGLAGAEIERRYEEDRAARVADLERRAKPPVRQFMDDQFSVEAAQGAKRVEAAREGNELAQLAMLMQEGAVHGEGYVSPQYDQKDNLGVNYTAGGPLGAQSAHLQTGRQLVLPNESELVEPGRFGGGEGKKRIINPINSRNSERGDRLISSPIAIEVGRRNKPGGGQVEYTTPGRPADMPTPYVPPAIDGNGAPMPAPTYSSGPNPRQIGERQIAPASVQPSIAPDPWAMTGPARTPVTEAGGGGQKPPKGPFGLLASAPEPQRPSGGPMPNNLRDQLFALNGPYTDRPRSSEYMSSPDTQESPRSATVRNRKQFRDRAYRNIAMRDAGVISAGVLGSILGIDALTGNEEEEQV